MKKLLCAIAIILGLCCFYVYSEEETPDYIRGRLVEKIQQLNEQQAVLDKAIIECDGLRAGAEWLITYYTESHAKYVSISSEYLQKMIDKNRELADASEKMTKLTREYFDLLYKYLDATVKKAEVKPERE